VRFSLDERWTSGFKGTIVTFDPAMMGWFQIDVSEQMVLSGGFDSIDITHNLHITK
jgi:hypothetical protein